MASSLSVVLSSLVKLRPVSYTHLEANPGEYLESGECGLEVAQKYGYEYYDGVLNICIAGIVYTCLLYTSRCV